MMTTHDDDPDLFEFLLKYMYTYKYDRDALDKLTGQDPVKRVLAPVVLYAIADKYDLPAIYSDIIKDMEYLLDESTNTTELYLSAIIETHYGACASVDTALGDFIAYKCLHSQEFLGSEDFRDMTKIFPVFGADVALGMSKESSVRLVTRSLCTCCCQEGTF